MCDNVLLIFVCRPAGRQPRASRAAFLGTGAWARARKRMNRSTRFAGRAGAARMCGRTRMLAAARGCARPSDAAAEPGPSRPNRPEDRTTRAAPADSSVSRPQGRAARDAASATRIIDRARRRLPAAIGLAVFGTARLASCAVESHSRLGRLRLVSLRSRGRFGGACLRLDAAIRVRAGAAGVRSDVCGGLRGVGHWRRLVGKAGRVSDAANGAKIYGKIRIKACADAAPETVKCRALGCGKRLTLTSGRRRLTRPIGTCDVDTNKSESQPARTNTLDHEASSGPVSGRGPPAFPRTPGPFGVS
jgi:hypothetical protein